MLRVPSRGRAGAARLLALIVVAGLLAGLPGWVGAEGLERAAGASSAEAAAAGVRLRLVGRFGRTSYVTAPRGDERRLFVVEARGVIRVLRDDRKLRRPFLDIRRRVRCCGESGLLSMAFAPEYASSRRFYVYYTDNRGTITVDEFRRSARSEDRALPGSRRNLLRQAHRTENHKGGQLQFGPDRMLYVGLGDGGPQRDPARRGQDRRTLLGKILRIDPRRGRRRPYRIPRNNPLVRRPGVRKEIWAYGVRNPWRFSFTPRGSFVLGDVGQNAIEEIDYVPSRRRGRPPRGGYNFGWSVFEGRRRFRPGSAPGHVPPVIQRLHSRGSCAIVGGYVVRDRSLRRLYGKYVYGDFCDRRLRVARLRPGRVRRDSALGLSIRNLASFGEDARGRLYAMSVFGRLYRFTATSRR